MKLMWLSCAVFGLTGLSVAMGSVPSRVTDDTALYQSLSDIRVPKQGKLSFDADIAQLNRMERQYQENLPVLTKAGRVSGPMNRIAKQQYRFASAKRPAQRR